MEDDVTVLVQMFEESEEATRDARQKAERDRDYYDGKQWTSEEEAALKRRGQPVVVYNRIQRKVDYLSGLERQMRKDPKAFPRTPKDEEAAGAATDAIRFVCDDEQWDDKRSSAWDNLMIEGTGAILVGVKPARRSTLMSTSSMTPVSYDPSLTHIPWDRLFYDPASSKIDFSDARYMGIVTWYDYDAAAAKWKDREDILTATLNGDRDTDTYDDKPKDKLWADFKRKRVRVIEMYYLSGGKWLRCVFTRSGHLEDPTPSPYLDEEGNPENPIKARSLYIDRDNNRYGSVRVMISAQDEINKRHSKSLHRSTMRQARVSRASSQDPETIRRELAKPDGIIVAEDGEFEILEGNDLLAAEFNLLQDAKNEIDLLGANAALAGKNENDMSGRAILAQQQGGMVEVARMFDRLRSLSIEVYRAIWNRIRQVWTNEKWIRVTDDERNLRFVGLNQQVTVNQIAQEVAQGDPVGMKSAEKLVGARLLQAYLAGDEQARMVLGQFVQQNGAQVVETRNAVNELDVDIVIDEGMDTPTVQAEQFDTLTKMLGTAPPDKQAIIWEALFESSQLRNKDKILVKFSQAQQADPMLEQMKQVQMAGAVAEVQKTESETAKNYAQAQASDPVAQMQLAQAETAAKLGMQERQMEHGMALKERQQGFNEHMAVKNADRPAKAA